MSKGTPNRAIRIEDELWGQAKIVALSRMDTVSEVIRAALETYISESTTAQGHRAGSKMDSVSEAQQLSVFAATTTARLHLDRADMQSHGRAFDPGLAVTAVPMGGNLWQLTAAADGCIWVGLGSAQEIEATALLTTVNGNKTD